MGNVAFFGIVIADNLENMCLDIFGVLGEEWIGFLGAYIIECWFSA